MCVLTLVARITVGWSLVLVEFSGMAAEASRHAMLADQRVLRVTVVVERHGLPINFPVALLALLPEARSVNIIFLVAGVTACGCFIPVEPPFMAALAFDLLVIPLQRV